MTADDVREAAGFEHADAMNIRIPIEGACIGLSAEGA